MTTCQKCTRVLADGETAWADDWVVIDPTTGRHVRETRYTCDGCEDAA